MRGKGRQGGAAKETDRALQKERNKERESGK